MCRQVTCRRCGNPTWPVAFGMSTGDGLRAGALALPAPPEAVSGGSDLRRSQVICMTASAP